MPKRHKNPVFKRPDSPFWQYAWTIPGQPKRLRGSTETDKYAEACRISLDARDAALKAAAAGAELTVGRAFARYLEEYAQHLASWSTVDIHNRHLMDFFGLATPLHALTADVVLRYAAHRRAQGVGPGTINREYNTLFAMLKRARKWGVRLPEVERTDEMRLREPAGGERFLAYDEAGSLSGDIAGHARPIVLFAMLTGLRRANVLGLEWSSVSLDFRRIVVQVKDRTPEGKPHAVPITDDLAALLTAVQPDPALRRGPVWVFGNPNVPCGCIACERRAGQPIRSIKRAFRTARKKAGLDGLRFHDLRHTLASWMLGAGHTLKVVQAQLGHADLKTTSRYAHLEHGAQARAVEDATRGLRLRPPEREREDAG